MSGGHRCDQKDLEPVHFQASLPKLESSPTKSSAKSQPPSELSANFTIQNDIKKEKYDETLLVKLETYDNVFDTKKFKEEEMEIHKQELQFTDVETICKDEIPNTVISDEHNIETVPTEVKTNVVDDQKDDNIKQNQEYSDLNTIGSLSSLFQCDKCPYQTKKKQHLRKHYVTHCHKLLKCNHCVYQTLHKNRFDAHLLNHKNTDEIKMFKCSDCSFQSRFKEGLSNHFQKHIEENQECGVENNKIPNIVVKVYECAECGYQANYRYAVKRHMITHQNIDEAVKFKCNQCSFQSKHENGVKRHIETKHKNPDEAVMFKCEECPFQSRYIRSIKNHIEGQHKIYLNNKDIKSFKCDQCPYHSTSSWNFKMHTLIHKTPDEVLMFKCSHCPYSSKRKHNLKQHIQIHHPQTGDVMS